MTAAVGLTGEEDEAFTSFLWHFERSCETSTAAKAKQLQQQYVWLRRENFAKTTYV